jgi:hypothetical protein
MSISQHKFVLKLLICGLIIGLHSCNSPLAEFRQNTNLASPQESNMSKVIYPSLRLAANGSTVLLDRVDRGFQVYSIPDLAVRSSNDSYRDIVNVVLSNSGKSVGIQTIPNEISMLTADRNSKYKLPINSSSIRSLAISDVGDKLAIITVDNSPNTSDRVRENGVLEIWSLPLGDRPLASIELPVFDFVMLSANGTFSSFAVRSTASIGNKQFVGVYQYTQGKLSPKWTESGDSIESIAVALHRDWIWAVQADNLVGWHQTSTPIKLPGTAREHLIYSPTGTHLLAYRGEATINVTSQKTLFRLFDLSSLREVRRIAHTIDDISNAQFVLSKDLALLELRATKDSKIAVKELAWQN